jgi:predicted AlkP superfamily phosphohydrolase/phosphomutase
MIGKMMETMGKDSMIVLVSDHGSVATRATFRTNDALQQSGLQALKDGPDGKREVDWAKTRAFAQRANYVYVNLKGRDPDGIVEPQNLEAVKNQIVNALMDYTEPQSGLKPVAYALKREEARWIGIFGDDIGDVVYALRAPFGGTTGGVHGMQAPFAESEQGTMKPLLLMKGPGIRKGVALERNVQLQDLVPTACYLLGLPLPKDADGGVIYQALENPNLHLDEINALEDALAKMEHLLDYKKAQTHSY